ncbi:MAG TPA: trypsin-like peptidase domain-containing protein [Nitrosopumilus sp.]|jgi:S1-C subfamily serine protease|nr:trypsin-like peptidase domain-containing protein [Nitrosopumilus sp.]HJM25978.1 trypsin-like peptidase domain-containing protein [Nitrosopumilus sp.]HJO31064.1 trypsin-like peptidase domain-containing protein [Nitrosopumilus sp.]|tara:strand:- start:19122 stop:20261 length:1140 start_codon:yes stop_codon:yes gene_type:complete
MDKSGIFVGGAMGAMIVIVIFTILIISPPESIKPEIKTDEIDANANKEIESPYSKNFSLIEIFEKVEPGVVRINVQRGDASENIGGVGSGFVFDKKGHIITNAHVVEDAKKTTVTFLDGRSYYADIIGVDEFTDIAVIKVNADLSLLQPLLLGDSSELKVGEPITAIGNPFGLSGSMSSGIVSQIGRLLPTDSGYSIPDVIQTDAAINPGNSGGPLLNMLGGVVGINTAIQSTTGEFTGVGFAIPSQTVVKIVPTLIKNGEYQHPWIGISGRDIDIDMANVMELEDTIGFLVITVIEDSPASKAGIIGSDKTIQVDGIDYSIGGDIILSVDGIDVRKIDDILIHLQRAKSVGDEMVLEVLRDSKITETTIVLQERPNRD